MTFKQYSDTSEHKDPRELEINFKKHFFLFEKLKIFKNEYENNSFYINQINDTEISLYIDNLISVSENVNYDFKQEVFSLLNKLLFYFKEFKVNSNYKENETIVNIVLSEFEDVYIQFLESQKYLNDLNLQNQKMKTNQNDLLLKIEVI